MGPVSAEGWVELQSVTRFARVTGLRHSEKLKQPGFLRRFAIVIAMLAIPSCAVVTDTVAFGGEVRLATVPPPKVPGKHVIIFALDGTSRDQFMTLIRSGKAPIIAGILGKDEANGVFEHGYAAPDAVSMLPSSTVADWSAIFTGVPPAFNGVTGDEWFDREKMRIFAPVPISVDDTR